MTVSARFDGRVFVPDGPIDLPVGHRVWVVPEPASAELDDAPPDVREFCIAHDVVGAVAKLRRLAQEEMSGLTGTKLRIQADPESDASWVVVEAQVASTVEAVLADSDAVLRRWIGVTEPRERDHITFTTAFA